MTGHHDTLNFPCGTQSFLSLYFKFFLRSGVKIHSLQFYSIMRIIVSENKTRMYVCSNYIIRWQKSMEDCVGITTYLQPNLCIIKEVLFMLCYCKRLAPIHAEWTTVYDLESTGNQCLFYFIIHHFIILINNSRLKEGIIWRYKLWSSRLWYHAI
jgi:hypothetical protein